MLKNALRKAMLLEQRRQALEIIKICLEGYKRTKDEMYWENAQIFSDWSKLYKKELDELG